MRCRTEPTPISTLWLEMKKIDINPPYQREAGIWSVGKKQLFIDSIYNGYDVPKLYFHDRHSEKKPITYSVVDGKQRLTAIWGFIQGEFGLAEDFKFSGEDTFFGEDGPPEKGKKFGDLTERQRDFFKGRKIDIVEIIDADEDDIEELFSRLNNGEPLNAAEKRNAMGGNFIRLVRTLAKDDVLKKLLPFADRRMSHSEVAAKLLRLEQADQSGGTIFVDLKKKHLDAMVENYASITNAEGEGLLARVKSNLRKMTTVFGDGNPLLKKQSYPQLYYGWVKFISSEYAAPDLAKQARAFLEAFQIDRAENLERDEDHRDAELSEYGRMMQQGTNDLGSMEERSKILTRRFLQFYPDLEIKDKKRGFNEDERYAIWQRAGKKCQNSNCDIELEKLSEMHADHIVAHSKGGKTKLSNAQALCEACNKSKSAK